MKNLFVLLTLVAVLAAGCAFAGEEKSTTDSEELILPECYVDEDGDGVCDICNETAEKCAADFAAGKCETCTECGDKASGE